MGCGRRILLARHATTSKVDPQATPPFYSSTNNTNKRAVINNVVPGAPWHQPLMRAVLQSPPLLHLFPSSFHT